MKKMIIMGASSGIGLHTAEALLKRGMRLGLASRHTETLRRLAAKYPGLVEYESIDVTHRDAPHRLETLIEKLGGMDIYFHVSGIGKPNSGLDPNLEAEVITTNAAGFVRMTSAAFDYFRRSGRKGQIAAVTSVAGTNGIGRLAAYSASKRCASTYLTALEQLAHEEGVEVAFTDIRPGWVRTPLLSKESRYPMEMTPEEVVPLVIKAIVRKKRVAVIDCRWALAAGLWKCIPDTLWVRLDIPTTISGDPFPEKETDPETPETAAEKQ
ncbi:MAG: SDR family NAD(P)-dependent oxidoreductase [Muribaculaceae bacterium]|nr:SDR family NAD(P)-dependent oxidoreductase [Muribaculaceae bacterium]